MTRHVLLLAGTAAVLAALTSSAAGTPPGANGRIAFAHPVRAQHTTFAISAVNADGSGLRQLTHPADGVLDDQPDFAPDGRLIAFQRCAVRCAIWTMRVDGSSLRRLGPACARRPPACEDRTAPAWSPDGSHIAFVRSWGAVRRGEIAHSALMVSGTDGRGAHVLRKLKAFAGDFERPAWSPDGTRLVIAVAGPAGRRPARALYEVLSNGTGLRRLTAARMHAGDHPDFAPVGDTVLFGAGARRTHDRGEELYVMPSHGGPTTKLTSSGRRGVLSAGSYSPDGSQITFARLPAGESFLTSLYVAAADGTGARPIVRAVAAEHPDWGPSLP